MLDNGLELYLKNADLHLAGYKDELDELALLSDIGLRDYRVAERLLQLITELAIGLSKHRLKSFNKTAATNGYQTFIELNNFNVINDKDLLEWRKIIGLRNSLVHDYLNIDKTIVKQVIKHKKYEFIIEFCAKTINELS